ncbi:hypothetical protein EVAR_20713_1 [Eumeta japonica]|uniref:Uncharacterized protein n=1 Tax=Eumeta variegata TaxID=151549 RepID=A0A4C1V9S9_EUMVA|nr:hypothetical protein EVAR_20713_1 [Eumeta japonica]
MQVRNVISSFISAVSACKSRISSMVARVDATESRQCQQVTNDVFTLEGIIAGLSVECVGITRRTDSERPRPSGVAGGPCMPTATNCDLSTDLL